MSSIAMKKILVGIFFAIISMSLLAKETVTIVYAFGPADTMANYSRTLVAEANRIQDKYTFVFDTKPGGGGAVAANWLSNNPNNLVQHSSAFFIRPNFYPNDSYNMDYFKELLPQCVAPMAISSVKYKGWSEVPKDKSVTVGIAGLGSATHLIANQIIKVYPNIILVPFKNTSEIFMAMIGGHVDFTVSLLGIPQEWNKGPSKTSVNILGITGNHSIDGLALLINQGFPGSLGQMDLIQHLIVSSKLSDQKFKEWHKVLTQAALAKSVHDSYAVDHCKSINTMTDRQTQIWFGQQIRYWKELSQGEKN
jgi:tripartite-type tricarboxylate transporter receptor subunit TctC